MDDGSTGRRQAEGGSSILQDAELDGLRLSCMLRTATLLVLGAYLPFETTTYPLFYYYPILLLAAAFGVLPYLSARAGYDRAWPRYAVAVADAALMVFAVAVPNPFDAGEYLPPAGRFKLDNVMYPVIVVALYSLSFSPRLVLWIGGWMTALWLIAIAWATQQPGYGARATLPAGWGRSSAEERIAYVFDPFQLHAVTVAKQVLLILIVSAIAATVVARARGLVLRRVQAERARTNLARYFSPNMVESLAAADQPLRETRRATVAIMFVDVVGFTALAEHNAPEDTVALLRDLFARLEACVFRHDGTLEKFLGDGLMATFGAPIAGARDAVAALACGRDMVAAVDAWNHERVASGQPAIRLAVGIHWGPVVLGDIGGEARLEFATLGDSVNVAARLEEETRSLDASLAISAELRRAAVAQDAAAAATLLHGLLPAGARVLRGRSATTDIWMLPRAP